jgi:hypothetical protein
VGAAGDGPLSQQETVIKDEIERELGVLVGLPLAYASRVVDMGTFGFGAESIQVQRGQPVRVADYRLHIQEIWRIVRDGAIVLGYADYFYPPRDSTVRREDFVARVAPRTRRDDLIDAWSTHTAPGHIVREVRGTDAGDLAIVFEDGCTLETFASSATTDEDGSDEFWRLIPPRVTGFEPQFVVTAHGIER